MTRKVGFETGETRKGVADRVLDQYRAKARAKRAAEQATGDRDARDNAPGGGDARPKRQWVPILFLTLWLTAWSGGILLALSLILRGGAEPFLYIWISAAVIGWIIAFGILVRLIRAR